jgi:general stress protein YciG
MADSNNQNQGRGWHGDSKGHAKAGSQSPGKFKKNDERTKNAAQAGGEASPGKFEAGSTRTREAGRKGGSK